MIRFKTAALALAVSLTAATPALAMTPAHVNQIDAARVALEVAAIADPAARTSAQRKVIEARAYIRDHQHYQAYRALQDALALAAPADLAAQAR